MTRPDLHLVRFERDAQWALWAWVGRAFAVYVFDRLEERLRA